MDAKHLAIKVGVVGKGVFPVEKQVQHSGTDRQNSA